MPPRGLRRALGDLAGALLPLSTRGLEQRYRDQLDRIPNLLNGFGYDAYGMAPDWIRRAALPSMLLYRYWFRVEAHDADRIPEGRVMVVANHAGQLPFDGAMLATALLLEADPPRIARSMGEYWISRLPFVSVMASRMGAMVGTPDNCLQMLRNEECVVVFPEGVRGMNKLYRDRYQLQPFGSGFMRLALEAEAPILPVAIIGSEEQQPGLANLRPVARALGMPAFPVTPGFPLLGPLGLLPLPVKYRIWFGQPIRFEAGAADDDDALGGRVKRVHEAVRDLLERGLAERTGVFG